MVKRQRLDEEGSKEQDTSEGARMDVQEAKVEEEKQPATWEESSTMAFPPGLPMEHTYLKSEFYVRDCYSDYYQYVLRLLKVPHTEVVTVTGTSGIGTSLFYAYFLKRFSFEARETTIVTASFSVHSAIMKVAVWKGGNMLASVAPTFATAMDHPLDAFMREIRDVVKDTKHGLIYLYDGPPKVHPVGVQSVVFTSPNDNWLRLIRKSPHRPKVIMPLWTLEELKTAAIELDRRMCVNEPQFGLGNKASVAPVEPEDVPKVADLVEQRFRIFGGVARECLSSSAQFVRDMQSDIVAKIQRFHDVPSLRTILNQDWYQEMHDGICLYVPDPVNPRNYTVAEPTPFVKELLLKRLNKLIAAERDQIIYWLKSSQHAASAR